MPSEHGGKLVTWGGGVGGDSDQQAALMQRANASVHYQDHTGTRLAPPPDAPAPANMAAGAAAQWDNFYGNQALQLAGPVHQSPQEGQFPSLGTTGGAPPPGSMYAPPVAAWGQASALPLALVAAPGGPVQGHGSNFMGSFAQNFGSQGQGAAASDNEKVWGFPPYGSALFDDDGVGEPGDFMNVSRIHHEVALMAAHMSGVEPAKQRGFIQKQVSRINAVHTLVSSGGGMVNEQRSATHHLMRVLVCLLPPARTSVEMFSAIVTGNDGNQTVGGFGMDILKSTIATWVALGEAFTLTTTVLQQLEFGAKRSGDAALLGKSSSLIKTLQGCYNHLGGVNRQGNGYIRYRDAMTAELSGLLRNDNRYDFSAVVNTRGGRTGVEPGEGGGGGKGGGGGGGDKEKKRKREAASGDDGEANKKAKLCFDHQKGLCTRGESCRFSHE